MERSIQFASCEQVPQELQISQEYLDLPTYLQKLKQQLQTTMAILYLKYQLVAIATEQKLIMIGNNGKIYQMEQ